MPFRDNGYSTLVAKRKRMAARRKSKASGCTTPCESRSRSRAGSYLDAPSGYGSARTSRTRSRAGSDESRSHGSCSRPRSRAGSAASYADNGRRSRANSNRSAYKPSSPRNRSKSESRDKSDSLSALKATPAWRKQKFVPRTLSPIMSKGNLFSLDSKKFVRADSTSSLVPPKDGVRESASSKDPDTKVVLDNLIFNWDQTKDRAWGSMASLEMFKETVSLPAMLRVAQFATRVRSRATNSAARSRAESNDSKNETEDSVQAVEKRHHSL